MSNFSIDRRSLILAAAAAAPAFAASGRAGAQAPPAAARNAGHYRFRVGEIQATVLSDGLLSGPPRVYASNAPEAELREALMRAYLPTDALTLNINTLLIEIGGAAFLSRPAPEGPWGLTVAGCSRT
jgi:hypothetical protein